MEERIRKLYIGLDIEGEYAMVSYSYPELQEPQTVSPVAGSENFQIPIAICYQSEAEKWAYGEEAKRFARAGLGKCEENLYERAMRGEQVWVDNQMVDLLDYLVLFVEKMLTIPGKLGPKSQLERLVITVPELDDNRVTKWKALISQLSLSEDKIHLMDHKEAFYYYAMSQKVELSTHDMVLFELKNNQMKSLLLSRGKRSVPQLVEMFENDYGILSGNIDEAFLALIPQCFGKRIVSTVYLVGDDFESGWMKQSLKTLCHGRRVFLGKNIYSKGACYAAAISDGAVSWEFVYIGTHELKFNVSLKVYERGNLSFYTLISAGSRWYETQNRCEMIIDGTPSVDFWIQLPQSREARIETLELNGFPERENRTTRVEIIATPISDTGVKVQIRDLGFGEIVAATNKQWEYVLTI